MMKVIWGKLLILAVMMLMVRCGDGGDGGSSVFSDGTAV